LTAACAALCLLVASAGAQTLSYTLLRSDGVSPSPRFDGTIAYDPVARRIFLFGGQDSAPRNDLWAYSLSLRRWEEIAVSGPVPSVRFGHTLIFDTVRRRLVVFGGQASGFFSDVWAFDIALGSWQQLSADNSGPSRRYAHSAIYDSARDRMVISHGFTNAGRFDDTWAFHFATNSWQDLSPPGPRPLRRCLHHASHDAAGDQMYLYGGCASGFGPCPLGDLWAFDLGTHRWTERTVQPGPPSRQHYGMGFDPARRRLVLFGGSGGAILNDTWEFDPQPNAWLQPVIAGNPPSPRQRHETTVAGDRGTVFFFGGLTPAGATNELWMLGPGFLPDTPQVAPNGVINAFSGEGGAVAPGELVSIFGQALGPIEGVIFQFDPLTGRLPTSGPGVSVTWNGIPAAFYFSRSDQLNVQVPYELAGASEASLVVTVNGQASDPGVIPVAPTHPGLFPRVWNQDGTVNSPENPAAAGSIVVLYATGQGVTAPASPTGAFPVDVYPEPQAPTSLRIGGLEAELLFRGQAPGTSGVMQLNARLPQGLAPSNALPVILSLGSVDSQPGVVIAVR
jgi:uncharacterized protein (TIGR03437 family)